LFWFFWLVLDAVYIMKKTKKTVTQKFNIYLEGRKAAQNNEPRFAPYRLSGSVQTWFAGYDSVRAKH